MEETLDLLEAHMPVFCWSQYCHYLLLNNYVACDSVTHGLVRSMSKKGCSPDNSAAEGLFGRLKVEMYFGEGWDKRTLAELREAVDEYLHWYNEERIKVSLGGLSPLQYRRKLGYVEGVI